MGSDTDFSAVYVREIERVLIFLARRTLDVTLAADLAAETFALAFRAWPKLEGRSDEEVRAWLFTVARRQVGRYFRSARAEQRAVRRLGIQVPIVHEDDIELIEARAGLSALRVEVAAQLVRLDSGQRDAVRLRVVEERPYPEVAPIALVGISHKRGGHPSATGVESAAGLALSGGNCRIPARTDPHGPPVIGPAGRIRAASGRVSGLAWQLLLKPDTALPGAVAHGRLVLGRVQYGLCSRQSVPIPFGLVNAGAHGIVYGYIATGGGSYHVTVSAGSTPLATRVVDTFFFIAALPRSACTYRELSVTAISTDVTGLPPDITRSLDDDPTQLTTTMGFGACRPHALVTATSEHGENQGRNPNAPLATSTGQLSLAAPPGSESRIGGRVWELTHDGQRGVSLFAFGLRPGRYGVWLLGPQGRTAALGAVNVKHDEILKSYDLPADVRGRQIAVAVAPGRGQLDAPGTIVLRATLR